ncbi:phosphoribosylglycinamide formyltransferase, partial [Patescibacteria group bacterium]|nr:phosphoribosylglycinamide formyltransferase [Patescibacteria group bacterium]
MTDRGRLGILISGTGSNMQALVQACERGEIPADVRFVGSDNPAAPGLSWAQQHGLDTFVVDYKALARRDWREIDLSRIPSCSLGDALHYKPHRLFAELLLGDEIEQRGCDLLCLAGFMRLLTPFFVRRISPNQDQPCIMNIHPSLLPAFPGIDGYGDTYRYGCRVAG